MKFVVQILIVDVNVYRNFGCVMVIGNKNSSNLIFENLYGFILVIVMMEVMKINVIVVCIFLFMKNFIDIILKRITSSSTLL
jgi:hypothetical protein